MDDKGKKGRRTKWKSNLLVTMVTTTTTTKETRKKKELPVHKLIILYIIYLILAYLRVYYLDRQLALLLFSTGKTGKTE